MAKFVVFMVVIAVIYLVVRGMRRKRDTRHERPAAAPEAMVRCAYCDVLFPAGESLPADGAEYCCEDHRRRGTGS